MSARNFATRTLWTGDNLDIMRGMNSESVDLIYSDPPFNSNQDYAAPIGSEAAGAAFKDTWALSDLDVAWMGLIADELPAVAHLLRASGLTHSAGMQSYLTMMAVRLLELRRILKPTGSIYLHCDSFACSYLKPLMDAIFGAAQFQNIIVWKRSSAHNDARRFGRVDDHILYYSNGSPWRWNQPYQPYDDAYLARFSRFDSDGRRWTDDNLTAKGLRGGGTAMSTRDADHSGAFH